MGKTVKFVVSAVGIFVSYFYFGILYEKVNKSKYSVDVVNEDGTKTTHVEKFTYSLSLVFFQVFVGYLFSKVVGLYRGESEEVHANGLTKLYAAVALTYLLAMVSSTMAMQWVSYPTQIIGKSAKPIPIMFLGVLIGNKSYPLRKYIFVAMIVIGIIIFMYNDQSKASRKGNETQFGIGDILLVMSLIMDGVTGGLQEILRVKPSKPTGDQMMRNTNFWASFYLIVALVVFGEGKEFIAFASRHPESFYNIAALSVASALGQHFIYVMVANFGPLPVSTVTTTRKFVSVIASNIIFGSTLLPNQWVAAVIVFGALFLDSYYSQSSSKKDTKK